VTDEELEPQPCCGWTGFDRVAQMARELVKRAPGGWDRASDVHG